MVTVQLASTWVMFEAPITAMKISAGCAAPVAGSMTDIRVPE